MRMNKKIKRWIIICVLVLVFFAAGIVVKNIMLHQIKERIQSSIGYTSLHISFLPPSLILEDVRSLSVSPFFTAKRVKMRISYRALMSREKPLDLVIEQPELRIYRVSAKEDKKEFSFTLPFAMKRGLIKKGKLYFWGKEDRFRATGLDALFVQKNDRFSLKAESEESLLYLATVGEQIEGKIRISMQGQGDEIRLEKATISGADGVLKAEGSLVNLFDPEFELKTYLKAPTPLIAKFLRLPFEWQGKAEGEGTLTRKMGIVSYRGILSSESLVLNNVPMGRVRGKVNFNTASGGITEFTSRKKSSPPEFLKIQFRKNKIWGTARGFHLDPMMNFIALPWPFSSPAWGGFTIENGNLSVEGEFRDVMVKKEPDLFPLKGSVNLQTRSNGEFTVYSDSLASSFADVNLEAKGKTGKEIDLRIQGEVIDLMQARQFTSLLLAKSFEFPETGGRGQSLLLIKGNYENPEIESKFSFSPGQFGKLEANLVEGEAKISDNNFFGQFNVEDPSLKGQIAVFSSQKELKADIQMERGRLEKIFPAFELNFPLIGEVKGNVEVIQRGEDIQVKGNGSCPSVRIGGQELKDLTGKFDWRPDSLSFSDFRFRLYQGIVKGDFFVQSSTQKYDMDISAEGFDLSSFYPSLKGSLAFQLKGEGLSGKDLAAGPLEIKGLEFSSFDKTDVKGELKADYSTEQLSLTLKGNFFPGENPVNVSLRFPFKEDTLSAEIKGTFKNLDLFLPWNGAKGKINYLTEIKGPKKSPRIRGVVDFNGPLFPLYRFAHAVHDYSGLIFVEGPKILLRSLKGKFGGGHIQGYGEMRLGKEGLEYIDIRIDGEQLLLSPMERTRAFGWGTLNLIKDDNRFLLTGELSTDRLLWRRDLDEKFVFYSIPFGTRKQPGFFDDLTLNVRLKAEDDAWIENSLGKARGRFDLTLSGNVLSPVILGDVEILEGDVYFQDRKFRILRGLVSFFNPATIEPYVNFKGETYIKNYRIMFSLTGFLDRLNPEFSSSPPLPPEDVLALLTMGEAFKRTYSYERSTQLSTASLLSFQLSEEAKKRAEKLFSIDRFRIDPFVLGSSAEMTARLTLGKKLSRNFFILYSTNLTTQKEEIARLEWELTNDFSVVGTRDEEGRFSLDVKIHRRF